MSFERVGIFGIVEVFYLAPSGASVLFQTDLPGNALVTRATLAVPASAVRRTAKFRLPPDTKGKLYKVKITSTGIVQLFGGRVFARPLGSAAPWAWISLPIPATSDEWTSVPLPIPKTADEWTSIHLPIVKTADEFTAMPIPMEKTPDLQQWIDIPVAP